MMESAMASLWRRDSSVAERAMDSETSMMSYCLMKETSS